MFVAELDRPWTETPFMFQGFHLRTDQQLEALKKHCKHVFIDVERTEKAEPAPAAGRSSRSAARPSTPRRSRSRSSTRPAAAVFSRSAAKVDELLRPVSKPGGVLEAKDVKESVTQLTDSVVRNPDAMLLVTRLREKSAAAHARALQVSIYMIVFARFLAAGARGARAARHGGPAAGRRQDPAARRDHGEERRRSPPRKRALPSSTSSTPFEILKETPGIRPRLPRWPACTTSARTAPAIRRGLKGDEIGLYGSIAAIADTFDALTAPRALGRAAVALGRAELPLQGARHRLPRRPGRAVHPVRRRVPGRLAWSS